MDIETLTKAIEILAEQIGNLTIKIEKLEAKVDDFESTDFASHDHYHDEYANVDHVERSESSFSNQISNLRNSLDNLEYRVNDAERKAERAQSTADNAARQARGGW